MSFDFKRNIEAIFWIAGLGFLVLQNPEAKLMSMCLLDIIGFNNCPGCGLGTSISYLFDGQVSQSLQAHYLGIPVVIAILYRIFDIAKHHIEKQNYKMLKTV